MNNKEVISQTKEHLDRDFSGYELVETRVEGGINGSFLVRFTYLNFECYFYADKSILQLAIVENGSNYSLQQKYPELQGKWQTEENVDLFLSMLKKELG